MATIHPENSHRRRRTAPNGVYAADLIRPKHGWYTSAWAQAKQAAQTKHTANAREHYKQSKAVFVDHELIDKQRAEAIGSHRQGQRAKWIKECDKEILDRLSVLVRQRDGGTEELRVSPTVWAVLKADLAICAESSVLYASAQTIATKAHVCTDTVYKVHTTLEQLGILLRRESGGIDTHTGKKKTNVYFLNHQALRRAIGVECRYESKYEVPQEIEEVGGIIRDAAAQILFQSTLAAVARFGGRGRSRHPYYNGFGFTRTSRKKRSVDNPYSDLIKIYKYAVPALKSALQPVRNIKNHLQSSKPYLSVAKIQISKPIEKASTPLRGSLYDKPALYPLDKLSNNLQATLLSLPKHYRTSLLADAAAHTNSKLAQLMTVDEYLETYLDADTLNQT